MKQQYHFFIPAKIERGGFTSERTFTIKSNGGNLIGTANVAYLRDEQRQPLDKETPGYGTVIEGFVQCRKIKDIDERTLLIEVPSADVIHVDADTVTVLE